MHLANPALKNLPPQVQQVLPMLGELDFEQRFLIIDYLYHVEKKAINSQQSLFNQKQIAEKRFNRFPNAMTMSDDFDEYLGDDFWFPEDDILYK